MCRVASCRLSLRCSSVRQSELTLPDLSSALSAHGVQLSKADYFADSVFAGGMLNVNAAVQSTQNNVQAASAGKADAKKDAARKK